MQFLHADSEDVQALLSHRQTVLFLKLRLKYLRSKEHIECYNEALRFSAYLEPWAQLFKASLA